MTASDAELVRRCLQGDNAGFDALVKAYQKQVYCFCYRMLNDAEDATDAAQASFIKAYQALENFREDASFLTWLFKIASNTCIDRTRSRARRPSMPLDDMIELGQEPASDEDTPEESALRGESDQTVRDAIKSLPERYRASLVLFHFSGMSIKEISSALGRPENTVKSDLRTAREKLRRSLEGVVA